MNKVGLAIDRLAFLSRGVLFKDTWRSNQFTPTAALKLIGNSGPLVIEIGCADGLDSAAFLGQSNSGVRLISFEPDPRFHDVNVELASQSARHIFISSAVSDRKGIATFHQSNTPYSSSLQTPNLQSINEVWPEIQFTSKITVPTVTLDDQLTELETSGMHTDVITPESAIDLIWADVQGGEADLIRGAAATLARTRFFYTEFSPEPYYEGALNLVQIADALGSSWELMRRYQGDALFRNVQI